MPAARVLAFTPALAEVLVEDAGSWRRVVRVEGVDAPDRAEELRRLLESGLVAPAVVALADPAARAVAL